jgi:DNA-binding NarL/FixJ family response regulator
MFFSSQRISAPGVAAAHASHASAYTMNSDLTEGSGEAHALRCFVVEDSQVIRQNLVATLEEMISAEVIGYAEDEAGAVDWLRQGVPCDLLIIDIFLKSGTGLEVLRQAQVLHPQAKLVVLTNYATSDMRRRCAQLGADEVFDKSAELEEMLAYCESLAASRQP